ncbi:MAG TPA: hypothetical protein VFS93_01995 [Terrimesophilobacter sp.]|nr:hypothetical protein [Terrimesophilobacter sp.]
MSRRAELIATSRADDLSLRALADVAETTVGENVRIVGGQMASLLLTTFPVAGVPPRRTRDADTAITTELASSGILHDRLISRGYSATSGNSYTKPLPELAAPGTSVPELSVDLLVPSLDGRFRPSFHGGRSFDAAPGLAVALAADPITIDAGATLLDGTVLEFVARVPTVELALVIKAHAYASRLEDRDVEDIYRLLEIADSYPAEEIGGWQLNQDDLHASRSDTAVRLHQLARRSRRLGNADVPAARLAALIAAHISRP